MTKENFRRLMEMQKHFVEQDIVLPAVGNDLILDVNSKTSNDAFIVDLDRKSSITLYNKKKLQERYAFDNQVLMRLEVDCRPHRNPDGNVTTRNHIHIYKEGYAFSWAYSLEDFDSNLFKNLSNFEYVFTDFCEYCNIDLTNTTVQGVI